MRFLADVATSPLLRRALMEIVIVGALCGVVGSHVVLRRLPFASMALAHSAFPGVVAAHLAGLPLVVGSWGIAAATALSLARLGGRSRIDTASAAGVVLAGASALGALLVALGPPSQMDLSAYLVGSLLTVSPGDVVATVIGSLVICVVLAALHKELTLGAFDPAAAAAIGYPVARLDAVVLVVVAVAVVTATPAVGVILVVALLVAPAAAARQWVSTVGATMVLGALLGGASGVAGLWVSHALDIAAGAAVVMVACVFYVVSLVAGGRLVAATPAATGSGPRGVRNRPTPAATDASPSAARTAGPPSPAQW